MAPTSSTTWLLANHILAWMGKSECVCVSESRVRHPLTAHLCLRTDERNNRGFSPHSPLSRWIVDVLCSLQNTKQVSAGNWGDANEHQSFSFTFLFVSIKTFEKNIYTCNIYLAKAQCVFKLASHSPSARLHVFVWTVLIWHLKIEGQNYY